MFTVLLAATSTNEGGVSFSVPEGAGMETYLTVGAFVAFMLVLVGVQLWAFARRRRGEEATTSRAEGAEGIIHLGSRG